MQFLRDFRAREIIPGFFGKMIHGNKGTLAFWDIKKGSALKEHHHVHEQITYVQEGELEMIIDGEKISFSSGSIHVIPSGTPHSAIALSDCKVIDVFVPVREDYKL